MSILRTDHPLTRGLAGLWLPVHGRAGGSRLYDISGRGSHGALTNMDPASDWVHRRAFAFPALELEGGADEYIQSDAYLHDTFSYTVVFRRTTQWDTNSSDGENLLGQSDGSDGFYWVWWDRDGGRMRWRTNGGNVQTTRDTWDTDTLYVVTATQDGVGGNTKLMTNGTLEVDADSGYAGYDDTDLHIGAVGATEYDAPAAQIQAVIRHGRVLSQGEHTAFYKEARRSFEGLLRRRTLVSLATTDTGGAVSVSGSLSGAPGTLSAALEAMPAIQANLQGNAGTLASGIATIAAVEAAMTGNPGALVSAAEVKAALTGSLSGQAGALDASVSASDLTSVNADLAGAPGSLTSALGALAAIQASLQGQAGSLSAQAEITAAIQASLQGSPGQLAAVIGDVPRLATLSAEIRDTLNLNAELKDTLTLDAELTD